LASPRRGGEAMSAASAPTGNCFLIFICREKWQSQVPTYRRIRTKSHTPVIDMASLRLKTDGVCETHHARSSSLSAGH
jgi:hypothetical protein